MGVAGGLLIALLLGLFAGAEPAQVGNAWVDPAVSAQLAEDGFAEILVVFENQASLGDVFGDWEARGVSVVSRLQMTADVSQMALRTLLEDQGVSYRALWIINALALRTDRVLMETLAAHPDVVRIVSNAPIQMDLGEDIFLDPVSTTQRGVESNLIQIRADRLWSAGYTGEGILIGVADTGVQWDHPALKAHYAGWNGADADHNYHWWDAIHEDGYSPFENSCGIDLNVPCDDQGHGTHVTGIAVGDDGGANQIGTAPGARWIACRNMEGGYGTPNTYLECYQFFLAPTDLNGENPDPDQRPHIVNNSFACIDSEGCTSFNELHQAVEALRAAGIFMAVSAGNIHLGEVDVCGSINAPPGLEENVFTIGAVDGGDAIANFSSRGPITVDGSGRLKPDLVAPGVNIRSSTLDGYYSNFSGTSMAAPQVAGGVALLWSAIPELVRDVALTEWLLGASAQRLTCGDGDCCFPSTPEDWPNTVYGFGRLDLFGAYELWETRHEVWLPLFQYSPE